MLKALRLDWKKLNSHLAVFADTGGGKSLFLQSYLREVERNGETAIIWDPDKQYAQKFRSVERGDWVLDPTCTEVPYWDPRLEYQDEGEAYALSTCFFPDNPNVKDPFWNNSARGLLAVLCALHRPTIGDLALWCANDAEIDYRVQGTEYERILTNNAPGMRSSIISHLNQIAQPLRMMPQQHPEGRRTFSVRDYCAKRNSWVFITSDPRYMDIMKPLHAFFLSSFIQRFVAMGRRKDLPRVHIIFEEASTIAVQEFHLALIRLRKTNTPVVYAIQNFSDLKAAYGERAETAFSQAYYKIFMRLGSFNSAKLGTETIGQKEVRRMRETWQQIGRFGYRRSFTFQPELMPIVPEHKLQNLEDREGYVICPGKIAAFRLPIVTMPDREPMLEERIIPPMLRVIPPQIAGEPQSQESDGETTEEPVALIGQGVL